ncbi:SMP-30/gluconolactonase/LRE family protein [Pseudonocardia broussonetiae]|uniref:SMP-30/gluconolactonase/LRE family protein n=1 Tax=Pseudonocardia broussonetiae TaxID=2736640 RepID=A0A6M6JTX2_9PSEU|nr:SMP-30/gluconolactonase/LRE family protein [Pseudonocardia broussonetiae]
MPTPPARAAETTSPTPFPPARLVPLSGNGAEDVVIDAEGRVLCGVEDGRILRLDVDRRLEETIADTGGRPLGLEVLPDGRIVVCDAHRGLLRLDPATGAVETLVDMVDDVPLRFCSNATAAADGTIWFTESSSRYDFEHYLGALLEHRPSGRLLRRDPDGRVEVVLDALHFANGVALTSDGSALLFAETNGPRLSRLDLGTGAVTVIADNLPGYPDNISRGADGRFWVAFPTSRNPGLEKLATSPAWVRKLLWSLPDALLPDGPSTTWLMAFDEQGRLEADLQDDRADFHTATGAAEHDGRLHVASPQHRALLVLDLGDVAAGPRRTPAGSTP